MVHSLEVKGNIFLILGKESYLQTSLMAYTVFSIRKSLRVLQKAPIKIVTRAIYTCQFFSYTYTPVLLENKKLRSLFSSEN